METSIDEAAIKAYNYKSNSARANHLFGTEESEIGNVGKRVDDHHYSQTNENRKWQDSLLKNRIQ